MLHYLPEITIGSGSIYPVNVTFLWADRLAVILAVDIKMDFSTGGDTGMLYALNQNELQQLRKGKWTAEFIGAEILSAVFRTDPAVLERILPRPLRAPTSPLAFAFVAHYPQTNFGTVYSEAALFVQAEYRGRSGMYCLSMPVDDDMAMAGGREVFGYPKKMAESISLEREGSRVIGSAVRKGTEILRIEAETKTAEGFEKLAM